MINVNMTDKAGVTLATAGKYCADNVKVTPSAEILRKDEQAKTATPTTSAQDITPDAGKALSKVTVNPITAAIVGNLDASSFAASIVAAVEGKGVTVPSGTLIDGMAALIESIEAGGDSSIITGSVIQTVKKDELLIGMKYADVLSKLNVDSASNILGFVYSLEHAELYYAMVSMCVTGDGGVIVYKDLNSTYCTMDSTSDKLKDAGASNGFVFYANSSTRFFSANHEYKYCLMAI